MKFEPKELVAARLALLDKMIDYFHEQEGVEALYVQGSVANNSADEFSDIDFRVVVQPSSYERIVAERFLAPQSWGEWLYNEWAGRDWVCVSHFKPFNKVDVLYFLSGSLQPSPWFRLPTQIIYDPKNVLPDLIQASSDLSFTPDSEEMSQLISKGLAYAEADFSW